MITLLIEPQGQFILPRSTEHGVRSTEHAVRSTEHAERSTEHAVRSTDHFNSYFHAEILQSHDEIYCLQWESWNFPNYRFSSVLRAPYCVLRTVSSVLRTPCSVLRAAWKYELAFTLNINSNLLLLLPYFFYIELLASNINFINNRKYYKSL